MSINLSNEEKYAMKILGFQLHKENLKKNKNVESIFKFDERITFLENYIVIINSTNYESYFPDLGKVKLSIYLEADTNRVDIFNEEFKDVEDLLKKICANRIRILNFVKAHHYFSSTAQASYSNKFFDSRDADIYLGRLMSKEDFLLECSYTYEVSTWGGVDKDNKFHTYVETIYCLVSSDIFIINGYTRKLLPVKKTTYLGVYEAYKPVSETMQPLYKFAPAEWDIRSQFLKKYSREDHLKYINEYKEETLENF